MIYVHPQVFPNKCLSKLKECITVRDRLLSHKLEEHKVKTEQRCLFLQRHKTRDYAHLKSTSLDFIKLLIQICTSSVFQASLSDGDPRDLLDALLKGKMDSGRGQKSSGSEDEKMTDDHVLMTAAEAFGAGVETTSTTLLWILAYLLHHPEVRSCDQAALRLVYN